MKKPALSFLTEVEFSSAVSRKVRMNELGPVDANRILTKFTSHAEAGLYQRVEKVLIEQPVIGSSPWKRPTINWQTAGSFFFQPP